MFSLKRVAFCALMTSACGAAEQQMHSDFAQIDGKTGVATYKGNARLLDQNVAIYADEMVTEYNNEGGIEFTRLSGTPARMEHTDPVTGNKAVAEANEIIYRAAIGRIELNGAVLLQQQQPHQKTRVTAASLVLQQSNNQLSAMDAVGQPAVFERQQRDQPAYQGQALSISYREAGELLKLEGEARLTQGSSILEHQTILHDGVNRRTTLPKRDGLQNTFRILRDPKPDNEKKTHD